MKLISILLLSAPLFLSAQKPSPACKEWQVCRQMALEAAERKDYDLFHDLAWLAFNAGPRNNPELMALLARAQSLSGRPGDALVMLQRLAALGASTDAATSDDFAGVRALPGWPDVEAKLAGKPAVPPEPAGKSPKPEPKPEITPEKPPITAGKPIVKPDEADAKPVTAEKSPEPPIAPPGKPPRGGRGAAKAGAPPVRLAFSTDGFTVVGLAYDAVSGRFIVGDARDRRLLVLGERSGRVSSLAGMDAGFHEIGAFEIDAVEGDLWVVSSSSDTRAAAVHKLQLISGRVLTSVPLPPEAGLARFADVAITPQSVLVLDAAGRRVYRAGKKGKALDLALRLPTSEVTSLAPASDTIAYAAFDGGLMRLDLAAKNMTVVEPSQGADVSRLSWIRWFRGSLVGLQTDRSGTTRAVRVRLDDLGRTARAVDVLDEASVAAGPTTAGLVGNTLYYLARASSSDEVEVRKVALK